ncbi:MAG: hypothetical protein FJX76_00620 [Armatimonadetes bacterium]|nr:hypothetical protein [Armatimonadota bacterium]
MELIISVGILSTAILLVVGIFTFLFKASQKSVDMTAGTIVAESILQEYIYSLRTGGRLDKFMTATKDAADKDAYASDVRHLNKTDFFYTLYVQDITALLPPEVPSSQQLRKLRIVCNWWEQAGGLPGRARAGYGQLSVEVSRIIYEGDL